MIVIRTFCRNLVKVSQVPLLNQARFTSAIMPQTKIGQFFKRVGSDVGPDDDLGPVLKRKASTSPAVVDNQSKKVRKTDEGDATVSKEDNRTSKPSSAETASTSNGPKGWNNDYNPGKVKYHPIDDASWEKGQKSVLKD